MILNPESVVHYLLEQDLVSCEAVVDDGIEVSEIARRNRNFKARRRDGSGYFLKQVRRWEPETVRTLHAEAQCYKLAAEHEIFAGLLPVVPRFCSYDQRHAILVTELLDGAQTVTEHHFRSEAFPVEVGEQLGDAFGNYHRRVTASVPPDLGGVFLRRPAWALSIHELGPQSAATGLSPGIQQMLAMVRQFPQFRSALDNLRAGWRPDALTHGDIKWDNCVLCAGPEGGLRLKIVDWEMADWGDSCWDLAGIFSAYLSFWVQSLPGHDLTRPEALPQQAKFPIERMQPAIRTFWKTYINCRGLSAEAARELLRRTVLFTGARIIQTAFEFLQLAPQANSGTVLLLQLSMNVLENPDDAARELLGLEP